MIGCKMKMSYILKLNESTQFDNTRPYNFGKYIILSVKIYYFTKMARCTVA